MRKQTRKRAKGFIKAINKYNKGKNPKNLRVYQFTRYGKKREIIGELKKIK